MHVLLTVVSGAIHNGAQTDIMSRVYEVEDVNQLADSVEVEAEMLHTMLKEKDAMFRVPWQILSISHCILP